MLGASVLVQRAHGLFRRRGQWEMPKQVPAMGTCVWQPQSLEEPKPWWTYVYRDNLINWCHMCSGFVTLDLGTWLLATWSWLSMWLAGLKRQQLGRIKISPHSLLEEICLVNCHTLIFKIQTELSVHEKTTELLPDGSTKTTVTVPLPLKYSLPQALIIPLPIFAQIAL